MQSFLQWILWQNIKILIYFKSLHIQSQIVPLHGSKGWWWIDGWYSAPLIVQNCSSIRWNGTMLKFINRKILVIFLILSPQNYIIINVVFWLHMNVILGVMGYDWVYNLQSHAHKQIYFKGPVSRIRHT